MKIRTKTDYSNYAERDALIEYLSIVINPDAKSHFSPYKPNKDDDEYWVIDMSNNWRVKFFLESDVNCFEISYRYNSVDYPREETLAQLLELTLEATIVTS